MSILDKKSVLYHAVSSYQLLEVLLHRLQFHRDDYAVLILPDFITKKYPHYKRLVRAGFFDEVFLFPYLKISHYSEQQIKADTARLYRQTIPHEITEFSEIYVAGAHFYFSLYLLERNLAFTMFEDAAGMLSRPEVLYEALCVSYPLHAQLGKKYQLFDGGHPLIREIICLESAQTRELPMGKIQNFSVEETLETFSYSERRRIIRLFLRRRIRGKGSGILLTQHFANLRIMSEEEQRKLYRGIAKSLPQKGLFIKKHPDDTLDYREIFPGATVIKPVFPAEFLPYVFRKKPDIIYTFDSTGCENLKRHFIIRKMRREPHDGGKDFDDC